MSDTSIVRKVAARYAADLTVKFKNTIERVVSPYGGKVKREEVFEVIRHFNYDIDPTVSLLDLGARAADLRSTSEAAKVYAKLKKLVVSSLPESPTVGAIYVMDLAEPVETMYAVASITYRAWEGIESWLIRSPEGATFELSADEHARTKKRDRVDPEPLVKWIRTETDLPAKFKALREEKREVFIRTRENTGTCGACLRNIKLREKGSGPVMVIHGYKRPGSGYTIGRCYGVDYPPYELSNEASKFVLSAVLQPSHVEMTKYMEKLERDDPKELTEIPGISEMSAPIEREGTSAIVWKFELDRVKKKVGHKLHDLKGMIDLFEGLVRNWTLEPLPEAGKDSPLAPKILF